MDKWPTLILRARSLDDPPQADELVAALLDDFSLLAIEDLAERPLPPGGLWDPTFPPIPEPPPSPLHWRVFFGDAGARDAASIAIRRAFPSIALEHADVPGEDWAARSQRELTAIRAGRFVIAPPWDVPAPADDATVIVIEPSMGFGTGHHATTRLCLKLLSAIDVSDARVIDLGTGSGVLSMAAALGGARSVLGIDIDPNAVASAEASARLNTLPDTIEFRVGDYRRQSLPAADLVVANLTGGMLTSTAATITSLVQRGGRLVVSGFDHTEADAVGAALRSFREEERLSEDGWIALLLRR